MSAPLNSAVLLDAMTISESEFEVSPTAVKTIHSTDYVGTVSVSYSRVFKICKAY